MNTKGKIRLIPIGRMIMSSLNVAERARVIFTAPFVKKIAMSNQWVFSNYSPSKL